MTDAEILDHVKKGLGIVGTYQDDTLNEYIATVKAFMLSAGVPADVTVSSAAVGAITRGTVDLWDYGSGGGKLSETFRMMLIQLAKG